MSNPYAPPEDRPREAPQGDGTPTPPPAPPAPPPPPPAAPHAGPAGTPDRSPAGVPYERPRSASAAPGGPPPRATDVRRLAVWVRTTALLVLLAVVTNLMSFPWFLAAGVLALGALAVGGRALAVAAQTRQRGAPRAVLGLLLVVAVLSLARPGMALLTWDAESAYARCQAGALTVQAQNTCVDDYQQALDDRAAQLTGRTP